MVIDAASPALAAALAAQHANRRRRGVSPTPTRVSITRRPYRAAMPNQPEPEIIEAAAEIGVDPQALRDQLDSADLTPPTDEQRNDLPKLLARLEES